MAALASVLLLVASLQSADAYHAGLQRQLTDKNRLPAGTSIFGNTEEEVLARFHLHGPAADAATLRTIDV